MQLFTVPETDDLQMDPHSGCRHPFGVISRIYRDTHEHELGTVGPDP